MIESASSIALKGLQRAQSGMQNSANNIARANKSIPQDNSKDLTRSLVELNQYKNAGVANIKALKTADDMLGALLDITA